MRTAPQLVAALSDTLDALVALGEELDPADYAKPTGCPGWSVHDQFSHVADLESLLAGRPRTEAEVPELPHVVSDSGRFMEAGIQARRSVPTEQVLTELRELVTERLDQLGAYTDETDLETEVTGFFGPVPLGRQLLIRVLDIYTHEQDVRRATGRLGHESGPAAELTLRRYTSAWPGAVADVVPEGVVVQVEVTGPTTNSRRLTGPADAPADLTLTMPFRTAVALAAGRSDADPAEVAVTGDEGLAATVLAKLGVAP